MTVLSGFLAAIFALNIINIYPGHIQNYRPYFAVCTSKDNTAVSFAIRRYSRFGSDFLLLVDAQTLHTSIIEISRIKYIETGISEIRKKYSSANYVKALAEVEKNSGPVQNAGLRAFRNFKKGIILTADLCPSRLPLDRILFTKLIQGSDKKKAVPVALAVTGLWMEKHVEDIRWLMDLEYKGLLSITWMDHSYNHMSDNDSDLKHNFMLMPSTDCKTEIINTEKRMLELGLRPSVFFRFPGLVSNTELFRKITSYGLIPVGSDAWLAKNQLPKDGSIILVHANGHEPSGIASIVKLLETEKKKNPNERWIFLDLRECAAGNALPSAHALNNP